MMSSKNALMPGGAVSALGVGLGDQLKDQVATQVLQRKKLKNLTGVPNGLDPVGYGQAASSLGLGAGLT